MGPPRICLFDLPVARAALTALFATSCAATPLGTVDGRVMSRFSGAPLHLAGPNPAEHTDGYQVQPGDTLFSLARRYGTTVEALLAANGLDSPERLRAGITLMVPTPASPGATPSPASGSSAEPATVGHLTAPPNRAPGAPQPSQTVVSTPATAPAAASAQKTAAPRRDPAAMSRRYKLSWPVQGMITSRFGQRDNRPHDGIDISAPANTPVRAAADGEVLFTGERGGYGNLVLIRHEHGVITVYAHNARNTVRKGQRVRRGEIIARVGQTGNAAAPHLHFEVRRGVAPENPLRLLPP